jgi:hypothetical protein
MARRWPLVEPESMAPITAFVFGSTTATFALFSQVM